MSQLIPVDILSDDEDDGDKPRAANDHDVVCIDLSTPIPSKKRPKLSDLSDPIPSSGDTVFIIDDGPTPLKNSLETASDVVETPLPISAHFSKDQDASIVKCSRGSSGVNSTPSFVAETPMSGLLNAEDPPVRWRGVPYSHSLPSTESRLIHLGSDDESEVLFGPETLKPEENYGDMPKQIELSSRFIRSASSAADDGVHSPLKNFPQPYSEENDKAQQDQTDDGNYRLGDMDKDTVGKGKKVKASLKRSVGQPKVNQRMSKEEKLQLNEEKKQLKEQEKLQKAARKAEALEMKKLQKEKQKWEKGKFSLKSIVAEIDTNVVELGSIGV